jgi:hypothetical protein
MFLRVPGVVQSKEIRDVLVKNDFHVQDAFRLLDQVELALVGIGTCEIVPPLTGGDNFFTSKEFESAKKLGAVGEVNLRFIDKDGKPVATKLDDRVIGITLKQLKQAETRIGVAGGASKYQAIRAENKELKSLLKMYNKTKTKNEEFKQLLKDNLLFSQDYERILDAHNNNIKLDIDTIKILALFGFEPL